MIYVEITIRVYKLRMLTLAEIVADSSNIWWKGIAVNIILAGAMTLKLSATTAQSMTFMNYTIGVGLYSFFAASFNTQRKTY